MTKQNSKHGTTWAKETVCDLCHYIVYPLVLHITNQTQSDPLQWLVVPSCAPFAFCFLMPGGCVCLSYRHCGAEEIQAAKQLNPRLTRNEHTSPCNDTARMFKEMFHLWNLHSLPFIKWSHHNKVSFFRINGPRKLMTWKIRATLFRSE